MTDEEWMVSQAKSYLKTDIYAAKAWLITARTLYPRNFSLQFEAYCIEKNHRNVHYAAKILEEMLVQFPGEQVLWQEVHAMIEALQADNKDDKTVFLAEVFSALPSSIQSHLLLQVAESCQDNMLQLRLMLLVLTRHGDQVAEHGVKLIEKLLNNEKSQQMSTPVNCYRKYLVCDVLPLVLRSELPGVQPKQLIRWLQKSLEFFVCYITQPPQARTDTPLSPGPELGSPKFPGFSGATNKWRVSIAGLSDKESIVERPLHRLGEIVSMIGKHLGWDRYNVYIQSSEDQWRNIMELQKQSLQNDTAKQALYSATLLFFTSVFHYVCSIMPAQFAATASSGTPTPNVVMIEGIKKNESRGGVRINESSAPYITASKKIIHAKELSAHFMIALNCWRFLHETEPLHKEFVKLLQHWKSEHWMWLKRFECDVLIYQGHFKEACAKLLTIKSVTPKPAVTSVDLQLASCFFAQGNYLKSCECLLGLIDNLTSTLSTDGPTEQAVIEPRTNGRQLQLVQCTDAEVMPYAIYLMITCFREKSMKTYAPNDNCLGHLLVLIQYEWPKYDYIFAEVTEKIKRQGSFTYTLFFNYVVNIDILEEFAFLKTGASGKITLDILPISSKNIAQFRTVTRGVNKGVKEDFKVHLEKQVSRSGENIEHLLRTFLTEEQAALQQSLL